MTVPIRVMQQVWLLPVTQGDERPQRYTSMVQDMVEGKQLVLAVPMHRGYEVRMPAGTPVWIEAITDEVLMRFDSEVIRRDDAKPPTLIFEWPRAGRKIQRRNDVRVETMFPVQTVFKADGAQHKIEAVATDFSVGGVRLSLSRSVPLETDLRLKLMLPDSEPFACRGKVVRNGHNPEPKATNPHWAGVEFTDLTPAERRDLTRYIFDLQREQLRKGIS